MRKEAVFMTKGKNTRKRVARGRGVLLWAVLMLLPAMAWGIEKLRFKPGFNIYKPAQDVEVGREASSQADQQLPLLNDPQVERYISDLGHRLVAFAPNNQSEYVWSFKVVNSSEINAFALPGGFIYVNRGAIEAAEDEAQIAGVMAHESGHVVMRHGTNQASKAMLAELGVALLGQGESTASQVLARLGGFGVNSWMLKNSRSAESQADEVGTYILHQAGYEPRAMAQFFETIEKKYPQRTIQFFSDHPNPENRIKDVEEEIKVLGEPQNPKTDTPEFEAVKKRVLAMPAPPKAKPAASGSPRSSNPPPAPSSRMRRFEGKGFGIDYPENWEVHQGEDAVAIYPQGGIVTGSGGEGDQAYGASLSHYRPRGTNGSWGLVDGTNELVSSMRESNPNLRILKQSPLKLGGRAALSSLLENDSPLEGQKEHDQLVTVQSGNGLAALILIAPESAAETYQPTFDAMLKGFSVQ